MLSLNLSVNFSSGCDDNKLSVTNKLLNICSWHKSIFLDEFWWVDIIPFVSVNLVSISHNKVKIIIESNTVNLKSVHIHFDFKKVSCVNSLIWRQNYLKKTLVMGKNIELTIQNLIIGNRQLLFTNKSVVNNIKYLRINFISDHENFNKSVVLMFTVHTISWNDSQNVQDTIHRILKNFNMSL